MVLSEWSEGLCCVTKEASIFVSESDPQLWKYRNEKCSEFPRYENSATADRGLLCFATRTGHPNGTQAAPASPSGAHTLQNWNQGAGTTGDLQVTLPVLALLVRWPDPLCSPSQMAWRWRKRTVKGLGQVLALPPAAVDKSAPMFETRSLRLSFWNDKSVFSASLTVLKETEWDKLWKNSEY